MVPRQEIIDALAVALEPLDWVAAAWLGGSFASGRTDEWSDVDLQILVEDDRVDDAFDVARGALAALSPIAHEIRFPEPMWHGHSQMLFALRDADPCHFVDFVVMARSSEDRLLEPERHGRAQVLFDPEGLLEPPALDRARHAKKMHERLPDLTTRFFLLQNLVTKAVRRGAVADAASSYQAHTLRPLVELLRMRHCPDRYDFGLRYLDRDLPYDLRETIEALAVPASPEAVEEHRSRAEALFRETLSALDDGAWSLP